MENQIKSKVLKDIMKAMMEKDGNRLRPKPKAVSVSVEEMHKPEDSDMVPPSPDSQSFAHGGVVQDPSDNLHLGVDSDLSPDDAHILESLWDDGNTSDDSKLSKDMHDSQDDEDDDDPESDPKAGYG